jgi:YfiH family protein
MDQSKPLGKHTFEIFSRIPGLRHGVFTRYGGVSAPPYESLNVAWNNGDEPQRVAENLNRIKQDLSLRELVAAPQVHGNHLQQVTFKELDRYQKRFPLRIAPSGDALVTGLPGVGLLIKIADCQAVLVVDPVQHIIANIHCGWRGSVNEIIVKTVRYLVDGCGCRSRNLLAAISPSLGPCCAEFRNYRQELPSAFHDYQCKPLHFDFWRISRDQLLASGVPAENIEIAGRCTVCETDFFSYRREKTTGRLAAVLAWSEEAS